MRDEALYRCEQRGPAESNVPSTSLAPKNGTEKPCGPDVPLPDDGIAILAANGFVRLARAPAKARSTRPPEPRSSGQHISLSYVTANASICV